MDKINIYMTVPLLCGIGLGFCFSQILGGIDFKNSIQEESNLIPNSEQEIVDNCKNLNLQESAYCLRDNVETFFVYNITDDKYQDVKTLKEKGGDCYNYAKLYDVLAIKLGFNSKTIHIDNGEIDHRIEIVSDESGYCVIDLLNVVCWVEDE